MIKIINEGIFHSFFDAIGFGAAWEVLKGRFWQMIRGWSAIVDVWKADTDEEIDKVYNNYVKDIESIKTRYRAAEAEFAKQNSWSNAQYGDHMLFFNPGLAMGSALVGPLMNNEYRQDTRRLMSDVGIQDWGLTPSFIANWVEEDPVKERPGGRAITYDEEGNRKKTDIILFDYKDEEEKPSDKMASIMQLFVENKSPNEVEQETPKEEPEEAKPFSKDDAKAMAKKITAAFQDQGIFDEMMKVGKEFVKQKEIIVNDVVNPSAQTIQYLSEMLSSDTPEEFVQSMIQVSKSNKSLKKLNPQNFITQVDAAVTSMLVDEPLKEKLRKELKTEDINEQVVRELAFKTLRNQLAKTIINSLDEVYEKALKSLMDGITEKGLKVIKQTPVGAEYANLIETNIQKLETAIKSLDKLSIEGE